MTAPSPALQRAQRLAASTTMLATPDANADRPDAPHPSVTAMRPKWTVMRDLLAGVDAVRSAGEAYLPKAPAEQGVDFARRVARAVLYNATQRTLAGLVGMVFRADPDLQDDVPPPIAEAWPDIDGAGTHGAVFARRLFAEALAMGHAGILVDAPAVPEALTLADERALGVRPYWCAIHAEQVVNWRWGTARGATVLDALVLAESVTVPSGLYGVAEIPQLRAFVRDGETVRYELWQPKKTGTDTTWEMVGSGLVQNQTRIPFVPLHVGAWMGDPLVSAPPLYELANLNIAHYQTQSDHRHSLHLASVPILTIKGRDRDAAAVTVGPNVGLDLPVDGDAYYCEHKGTALGGSRQELQDLEHRMAILGLGMLDRSPNANETAQAKRLDKAEQDSSLASAARSLQDALDMALYYHARFLGLTEGGHVQVARDFDGLALDAQQIAAYAALQTAGQLSLDTLWRVLAEGHALPDDFDVEAERLRLLQEPTPAPNGGVPAFGAP